MIITAVKIDGRSVYKVMLAGGIIWQRNRKLRMYGDETSFIKTVARFAVPSLEVLTGKGTSTSYGVSKPVMIEIEMLQGVSENRTEAAGSLTLLKVLMLAATETAYSRTDSPGRVKTAEIAQGIEDSYTDEKANAVSNLVRDISSKLQENSGVGGAAVTGNAEAVSSEIASIFRTDGQGLALYMLDVNGRTKEKFRTSVALVAALTQRGLSSESESVTYETAPVNRPVVAAGASAEEMITYLSGKSCAYDVVDAGGDTESFIDTLAQAVVSIADFSGGNGTAQSGGNGNLKKYTAFFCRAREKNENNANAALILWYPPIGDGIPLVEEDGVDITKDGEVLEIRQAFRIIEHKDRGILEVI